MKYARFAALFKEAGVVSRKWDDVYDMLNDDSETSVDYPGLCQTHELLNASHNITGTYLF